MEPLLIVTIAPLAVAGLIYLVYFLGGSKRATLASEAEALERFQKDFPEWQGQNVRLSDDRHFALLRAADTDEIGLLFAIGDVFAARILNPQDIDVPDDESVPARIHFHDFTAPDIDVPRALLAA